MPQQPAMTTEGTLRILRIIHGALFAALLLYAVAIWTVPSTTPDKPPMTEVSALAGISVVLLAAGARVRRKNIESALETLRSKPDDFVALQRWRKGAVLSAAMAEAVALFSVSLHFMGGSRLQVAGFWIAGAIAMLLWWPQRP